jgi:hypothetical protein
MLDRLSGERRGAGDGLETSAQRSWVSFFLPLASLSLFIFATIDEKEELLSGVVG